MSDQPLAVSPASLAAEALFCSPLQPSSNPTHEAVVTAVAQLLRGRNASHRLLRHVAAAYGEHPCLAAQRMRWCVAVVAEVYGLLPGEGEVRP